MVPGSPPPKSLARPWYTYVSLGAGPSLHLLAKSVASRLAVGCGATTLLETSATADYTMIERVEEDVQDGFSRSTELGAVAETRSRNGHVRRLVAFWVRIADIDINDITAALDSVCNFMLLQKVRSVS